MIMHQEARAVLLLADRLAADKQSLKRSYIFMLFSGEEAGLIGSAYFTKSALYKKYNIVSMINMDMIGRMNEDKLTIEGAGLHLFGKQFSIHLITFMII